jgi:hypothetical protein
MRRKFKGGTTSLNLTIVVYDTTSTTGAGLSGLTHTTSGLILEYRRAGQSTWTQLGVATGLVSKNLGDYVSGGICANGDRVGRYEIGIPDAAIASGVRMVEICLRGAADMHPVDIEIELDAVDYQVDAFGAIKPTTAGRTLDVSATGEAGIDLANIGSPTTTVNLSGVTIKTATDVETDTQDIQSRIPAALVDGRIDSYLGATANNVITNNTIASNAIGNSQLATSAINAIQSGLATDTQATAIENDTQNIQSRLPTALVDGRMASVAQVVTDKTGYTATVSDKTGFSLLPTTGLGNQTSDITGNLSGSVGSVTGAVGSVTSPVSVSDKTGFKLASDGLALVTAWTVGITGNLTGDVTGSVGSISGVTFPTHFGALVITAGGAIDEVVSVNEVDELGQQALSANSLDDQIATAVAGIQVLSRLDSMIEDDGNGQFRFDTIAVSLAGGGGGGGGGTDWTANERTAIRAILGVPISGTTPTDPTTGILDEIRDQTALITSGGTVYVTSPVTATGQLASPLIIGDDYLAANGRRFRWTVELPSGYVIATSTARFGMRYEDDEGVNEFIASGTVTDATGGNVHLDFDVAKTVTGTLRPGWYEWSVEIVSATGTEITRVKSGKNVEWQEKQT